MEHRHSFGKLFKGLRTCCYFGRNLGRLTFMTTSRQEKRARS